MKIDNLYQLDNGCFYCLLSGDTTLKAPEQGGMWHDAVIYVGTDGEMRSTVKTDWFARATQVAEYTGNDESVMQMIRRCNPGDRDLDFVAVFESWHESEINITGHMLELAVGACLERYVFPNARPTRDLDIHGEDDGSITAASITITTADLQRVVQNYEITRVPEAHGFRFDMRKSFPDSP
jgi:hypothetical protein